MRYEFLCKQIQPDMSNLFISSISRSKAIACLTLRKFNKFREKGLKKKKKLEKTLDLVACMHVRGFYQILMCNAKLLNPAKF